MISNRAMRIVAEGNCASVTDRDTGFKSTKCADNGAVRQKTIFLRNHFLRMYYLLQLQAYKIIIVCKVEYQDAFRIHCQ